MNLDWDREEAQLNELRGRVRQLQEELDALQLRAAQVEDRLERASLGRFTAGPAPAPSPVPPPLPPTQAPHDASMESTPAVIPDGAGEGLAEPEAAVEAVPVLARDAVAPAEAGAVASRPATPVGPAEGAGGSFEMRLGTYWLVRVGIVMLLTAMVFFGKYAYQNFIVHLGPLGKVLLMYAGGGLLLGVGQWLQRGREALRNYGQVLFAGGLAAVYFTTYAAHHLPNLRVISSPVADGVLLLVWAGFMVWLADRRRSEPLALFAVGLAFYASAITRVGQFTLYSNLLLTFAALFLLLRNRWATLSTLSLVATYAGYLLWRFWGEGSWRTAGEQEAVWSGLTFLGAYWAVFTTAGFLSREGLLTANRRVAFLTLNNAAFFVLFSGTLWQAHSEGFWRLCLAFGAVLLVASGGARRWLGGEVWAGRAYLVQGLLLVTLGFIARFSGTTLGLFLAAESIVVLTLSTALNEPLLRRSGYVTSVLAALFTFGRLADPGGNVAWQAAAVGGLLAFNAWWVAGRGSTAEPCRLRWDALGASALPLAVWGGATWAGVAAEHLPAVLALESLVLTASVYLVRVRELAVLSQGYVVLAQLMWLAGSTVAGEPQPAWSGPVILAVSLLQSHWWVRQQVIRGEGLQWRWLELAYALAAVAVLARWVEPRCTPDVWLMVSGGLAIALTLYAVTTRMWWLAGTGQLLVLVAVVRFLEALGGGHPRWIVPAVPMLVLGLLSAGAHLWVRRPAAPGGDLRKVLLGLALLYRWVALGLSLLWILEYVSDREHVWVMMGLSLGLFVASDWRRSREMLLAGAVYGAAALLGFLVAVLEHREVYLLNLLAMLVLLVQQQAARRAPERFAWPPGAHEVAVLLASMALWRLLSSWVLGHASGFALTASWASLAFVLFAAGLLLGERIYRWTGLGLLAVAVVRVMLVDVWKLETLYRTLSFFALGLVLLALGFLYNRFQERIRRWL